MLTYKEQQFFKFKRFCFVLFWSHHTASRISVPRPGTEPRPQPWKPGILTTRPTRELPACEILEAYTFCSIYCINMHWVTFYSAVEECFPHITLAVVVGHSGSFIFLDNQKGNIHVFYKSNLDGSYRVFQNRSRQGIRKCR